MHSLSARPEDESRLAVERVELKNQATFSSSLINLATAPLASNDPNPTKTDDNCEDENPFKVDSPKTQFGCCTCRSIVVEEEIMQKSRSFKKVKDGSHDKRKLNNVAKTSKGV
ncbi:hypothetical protein BDQ12DRAFT_663630 [Crucibulum laeve]|uniref:Uncharacterized protein n=1 Tax=Crucibulum laeve TaxID=68775 RepID=A0A5C3MKA4_9AGAR|nr:hypothetical protein BDQ12DRAFT_663630 [Crucibulum laeve]